MLHVLGNVETFFNAAKIPLTFCILIFFDVKNLLKYYQILVTFSKPGQENALPIQAVTEKKSRKRLSFARARPKKIHVRVEPTVCLADFVMSGLDWHDVCTYFAEDEMLQDLRSGLLESHSSSDLGEYLYKVWLVASEEQF